MRGVLPCLHSKSHDYAFDTMYPTVRERGCNEEATLFVIIATVSVLAVVLFGCGSSAISNKDFEGTWVYDDVEARFTLVLNSDNSGQISRKIYGMQDDTMEAQRPLNWKMNADNSVTIHYEMFTGGESDETYELSQDRKR